MSMYKMFNNNALVSNFPDLNSGVLSSSSEIKTECIRKSIHFLIALVPSMAMVNRPLTIAALTVGIFFYISMEAFRLSGVRVPFISAVTRMASRSRESGRFIMGPVTLGLGALLALFLFSPQTAAIAIYALAFGDGFASLVGKLFGRVRPAFMYGKSLEGSLACFFAVFYAAWRISQSCPLALVAAVVATFAEAFPLEDWDNIVLPLSVGCVIQMMIA